MNRKKVLSKVAAVFVCLALVLGFVPDLHMVAGAASGGNYPVVSSEEQLLREIDRARHGDTIGISERIAFYDGVTLGSESKMITIVRENADAYIQFSGDSTVVQNIIFEGAGIDSPIAMAYITKNTTFKGVIFQNCSNSTGEGSAASISSGKVEFNNCTFKDNSAFRGGHIVDASDKYLTITDCVFRGGKAATNGGAIFVSTSSASFEISNSVITENIAGENGGGIYIVGGRGVLSMTKIYNNAATGIGDDYAKEAGEIDFAESVAAKEELFSADNLKPIEWEFEQSAGVTGAKLILESITENPENPEEPTEPTEPTEPEEPTEPTEPETPENPNEPEEGEKPGDSSDSEPGTTPDQPEGENSSSTVNNSTTTTTNTDNSVTNTDNSSTTTTNTTTTDNSSVTTDNSTVSTNTDNSNNSVDSSNNSVNTNSNSSTDNSTTSISNDNSNRSSTADNSQWSSSTNTTTDSNNTSTVNNYYTQEKETSGNDRTVQTIVIPIEGNQDGKPINQTITIEGNPATGYTSKSAEGVTLNVNVNIEQPVQGITPGEHWVQVENPANYEMIANVTPKTFDEGTASTGLSWYQAVVMCLLFGILVCLVRRR